MFQSVLLNDTKSINNTSQVNCAKECPCGVPVIPKPDQWLEVMVTGGFKVWHIIFIIIAFIITVTVVYCCFHRCRIPRTKQEIEADLMRTNLANKFNYHLQDLPNEPTTFIEALKKVQEFAEKLERDDAILDMGARKRKGWLKLKGKGDKQQEKQDDKEKGPGENETTTEEPAPTAEIGNNVKIDTDSKVPNDIAQITVDTKPKAEANGFIQVPDNTVDNNKKVISEQADDKQAKQAHRRKRKPGLSRTKATGRIVSPTPTGDLANQFNNPQNTSINLDQQPHENKLKEEKKQKRDIKKKLNPGELIPPPVITTTKILKHKSHNRSAHSPVEEHHVRIDIKEATLGINNTSADPPIIKKKDEKKKSKSKVRKDDGISEDSLPSLWDHVESNKSYNVMYQLHTKNSLEKITIEEWANFDRKLFRLDIINSYKRISYLINGGTGEIFMYRPYTCELLKGNSTSLAILNDLFQGHAIGTSSGGIDIVYAYGLGSLWLKAMSSDAVVNKLPGQSKNGYEEYTVFSVKLNIATPDEKPDNRVAYDLIFKFITGGKFIDEVQWLNPSQKDPVVVNAKVIKVQHDTPSNVFEIPIGYGCVRSPDFDHPLKDNIGSKLLQEFIPNQAVIEVITSRPIDQILRKWITEKSTIRLMRGTLKLNSLTNQYWVTMTQSRNPDTARLSKTKMMWATQEHSDQAIVYKIDDITGKCEVIHQRALNHIRLSFPLMNNDTQSDEISIGTDLISNLIYDEKGYHFIREQSNSKISMLRDIIYESRIDNFNQLESDGKQLWSGPVSVIKEISYIQFTNDEKILKANPFLATKYHTLLTLLFFDKEQTKIEYKAVINVLEQDLIDVSIMHKEMDVSQCVPSGKKEDVIIKYPIESSNMSIKLEGIQNLVKVLFTINLFTTTSIQPFQVSGIDVEFDNFYMYLKLTLLDLPLTQIFNMKRDSRLVFKSSDETSSQNVIEMISSSVEKCASSCDHYHCHRFSYDAGSYSCRIETKENQAHVEKDAGSVLFEQPSINTITLWSKYEQQIRTRSHLKPHQIVDLLGELITYSNTEKNQEDPNKDIISDTKQQIRPLTIRVERDMLPGSSIEDPEVIELKPVAISSDYDSMNEFVKEEIENENGTQFGVRVNDDSNLKAEYTVLFEDRVLIDNDNKFYQTASYDQCERLCESSNCKSFSYCNFDSNCHISNSLHSSIDIMKRSSADNRCKIFVLDYLSKFEDFGIVQPPVEAKKIIKSDSARDCSNACMEESEFNCQGFYQCNQMDQGMLKKSCLLNEQHVSEMILHQLAKPTLKDMVKDIVSGVYGRRCSFYSRSYLAQFDEYHGKKLKIPEEKASDYEQIEYVGAENCAKLCIEKSCLAFDICLDKTLMEVCQLAHKEIKKTSLEPAKRCTTFVLSDKSHFNRNNTLLIKDKPDKRAEVKENHSIPDVNVGDKDVLDGMNDDIFYKLFNVFSDNNSSQGVQITQSHWVAKMITFGIGSIVGVICVELWYLRDNIYLIFSNVSSRFRRQ